MPPACLNLDCPFCAQGVLDTSLGGVRSCCEELRNSVELQQQYERLVHGLQQLLALGSERLTRQPDTELHSRAQLQQQLGSHTVSLWETRQTQSSFKITSLTVCSLSVCRSSSSSWAIISRSCSIWPRESQRVTSRGGRVWWRACRARWPDCSSKGWRKGPGCRKRYR